MLEMHSKRLQNFPRGRPLDSSRNLAPLVLARRTFSTSLFLLHLLQSFCHLLKTLLKTLDHSKYPPVRLFYLYSMSCHLVQIFFLVMGQDFAFNHQAAQSLRSRR